MRVRDAATRRSPNSPPSTSLCAIRAGPSARCQSHGTRSAVVTSGAGTPDIFRDPLDRDVSASLGRRSPVAITSRRCERRVLARWRQVGESGVACPGQGDQRRRRVHGTVRQSGRPADRREPSVERARAVRRSGRSLLRCARGDPCRRAVQRAGPHADSVRAGVRERRTGQRAGRGAHRLARTGVRLANAPAVPDQEFGRRFLEALGGPAAARTQEALCALGRRLRATPPPWEVPAPATIASVVPTLVV